MVRVQPSAAIRLLSRRYCLGVYRPSPMDVAEPRCCLTQPHQVQAHARHSMCNLCSVPQQVAVHFFQLHVTNKQPPMHLKVLVSVACDLGMLDRFQVGPSRSASPSGHPTSAACCHSGAQQQVAAVLAGLLPGFLIFIAFEHTPVTFVSWVLAAATCCQRVLLL